MSLKFPKPLNELKIAVVMGGESAEREVSLNSGNAVLDALLSSGVVKAVAIDGVKELLASNPQNFDAVFNILHGESGENGHLAGLLACMNIPFTGCDAQGAVLSWNKNTAKTLASAEGILTPKSQLLKKPSELQITDNGPWIVKPTEEGSSVGLYYADSVEELKKSVEKALRDVDSVLVESFIKGQECTVSIIKGEALPVIRIQPYVGLYDYEAKYKSTQTQYFCPSGLDDEIEKALQSDALIVYNCLKLKGWARVDFILDEKGNRWFLEANTTPGMTKTSLVPKAAAAIGWNFADLVLQILSTAFEEEVQ